MKDSQRQSELTIFRMFADVCPLNINPASIVKRDPPEPDVLCVVADSEEQVGFELVEIIDEGWASLTSGQFRETRSLRDGYQARSGDYRLALEERIANALVYVSFLADVQAKRRRSGVPEILRHLSTIRPDFCGEWKPPVGTPLHKTVRAITISRGAFPGPEFDVEAVGAIGDPTLDRVRAKWLKSYASANPIELLAYHELQPQAPETLWLPRLESFVSDNSAASPFRRVWVFDVGSRSISCSFACPKSTGRRPDD